MRFIVLATLFLYSSLTFASIQKCQLLNTPPYSVIKGTVSKVVDGDTININENIYSIRMLTIDTPKHSKGDFSNTSSEAVSEFLSPLNNVLLFKGFFPNPQLKDDFDRTFSFVHLDVDLYKSTLDCLEFFWPRMVKGGIIISDDYKWAHTPGVKMAFDEFFKNELDKVNDSGYNSAWVKK